MASQAPNVGSPVRHLAFNRFSRMAPSWSGARRLPCVRMGVWERLRSWLFGGGSTSSGGAPEGGVSPGGAADTAVGRVARGTRVQGEPPSGNGASSFHLFWELPGEFVAVSADLEVLRTPERPRLCFWALQADFTDHGRPGGGGHLGLQFHPNYPGGTAVNWAGYAASGRELDGSTSALPSALNNVNTRDLPWEAGRR